VNTKLESKQSFFKEPARETQTFPGLLHDINLETKLELESKRSTRKESAVKSSCKVEPKAEDDAEETKSTTKPEVTGDADSASEENKQKPKGPIKVVLASSFSGSKRAQRSRPPGSNNRTPRQKSMTKSAFAKQCEGHDEMEAMDQTGQAENPEAEEVIKPRSGKKQRAVNDDDDYVPE